MYYASTTVTTIGFGDFHPKSSYERVLTSIIMMSGVACFTFIMDNFMEIVNTFLAFNKPIEDLDDLNRFFGVMKKFNNGFGYPKHFYAEFENFFSYKWSEDNNYAVHDEGEKLIFLQLPPHVQNSLYKDYLFHDFYHHFRKMLTFENNQNINENSFFSWNDTTYSEFMIELF